MAKKIYKFRDLFCGIGGFRIGLERNGGKCVFSSDIDVFAQQTYRDNFGETPIGDITKVEAKDIPSFDILAAGFPCQPFSYAGLGCCSRRSWQSRCDTLWEPSFGASLP